VRQHASKENSRATYAAHDIMYLLVAAAVGADLLAADRKEIVRPLYFYP
jgi:hypothetical protein